MSCFLLPAFPLLHIWLVGGASGGPCAFTCWPHTCPDFLILHCCSVILCVGVQFFTCTETSVLLKRVSGVSSSLRWSPGHTVVFTWVHHWECDPVWTQLFLPLSPFVLGAVGHQADFVLMLYSGWSSLRSQCVCVCARVIFPLTVVLLPLWVLFSSFLFYFLYY